MLIIVSRFEAHSRRRVAKSIQSLLVMGHLLEGKRLTHASLRLGFRLLVVQDGLNNRLMVGIDVPPSRVIDLTNHHSFLL